MTIKNIMKSLILQQYFWDGNVCVRSDIFQSGIFVFKATTVKDGKASVDDIMKFWRLLPKREGPER